MNFSGAAAGRLPPQGRSLAVASLRDRREPTLDPAAAHPGFGTYTEDGMTAGCQDRSTPTDRDVGSDIRPASKTQITSRQVEQGRRL